MVTVKELKSEIVVAMKEKDTLKKDTLRLLVGNIQNNVFNYGKTDVNELTEGEVLKQVQKFVSDLEKSKEAYEKVGQPTETLEKQIGMFEKYIPKVVSGEELKAEVVKILDAEENVTMKVMGKLKAELKVNADFKEVTLIVKEYMANK